MSHGYATASLATGLSSAFVWVGPYTTNISRINDGVMDSLFSSAAAPAASPQRLDINLGSVKSVAGVALLNHNLASGACTAEVYASADGITYGTLLKAASTIVTAAPNHKDTVLQFTPANTQWVRIYFTHTGSKTITLGEVLVLGTITTLTRRKVYGHGESERYITNRNESATGRSFSTFLGGPIRTKRLPFKDLNTSEKAELMTMFRATLGGVTNLLWIEYIESTATAATDAAMECLWCKLQEELEWSEADFQLFDPGAIELVGLGREVGS